RSNSRLPTTLNARDQPPAEVSDQRVSGLTGAVHKSRREPWHTATSVDVRSQAFTTCAAAGCRLSPTGSCPRG
ncbi:hypothetical protein FML86_08235, partial [Mycobacterium tuberculosis]